ncbi:cytochrome P450 [Hysterangium stoloniferum]|nr:cytochrome P450 [Hysterangium stoloniferum]
MLQLTFSYLANIALAAVVILGVQVVRSSRSRKDRPPGPKPYPIIGNLLDFPKGREWLTFSSWAKTYGNCMSISILGQTILILDDYTTANELLELRSAVYSSRPRLVMAGDLVGFDKALALMPYTERFRQMRQLMKKELMGSSLKKYWPLHEQESRILIHNLISKPSELFDLVRHYSGSIILKVTYGYRTKENRDPFLLLAEKVMAAFSEASQPGSWMVDIIPWLRYVPHWMPGATFQRKAVEWSRLHMDVIEGPYIWAKAHQESPILIKPNFTSTILSQHGETLTDDQDNLLLWASASLFGGGADTTVAAISSFFLAMALHPGVQKTGQDEIDAVLGGKRLPEINDLDSLPYIKNIMHEVLRWNPVTPLGVPHLSTMDSEYRGYHIPKGTIVMANIWSMLHNPDIFSNPLEFFPDRFLDDENATKMIDVAFGFGRRACPGMQFAKSSMFIAMATALATSIISDAVDEDGHLITKDVLYKTGTISHPPRFKCQIKERSPYLIGLLKKETAA